MLTSPAQRAPKSSLVVPIILGIVLVPLSQIGMVFIDGHGTLLPWLVGTLACYFLIGGLGAFATVSGLVPAQASSRGVWVGFVTGISGACSAVLIVGAIAVGYIIAPTQPTSLSHPQIGVMPRISYGAMMGPVFPPIVAVLILLPVFLGANLFGIGLAPLGGMLGGYLRARVSPHRIALPEQADDQVVAPSGRGILVIIGVALLMAIIVAAGILMFNIIALAPHNTGAFPATIG